MRYFIMIILIGALLSSVTSCEYAVVQPKQVEVPDTLSFANDIKPIFEENDCAKCHAGGTTSPDLSENAYSNLTPYINTTNPEQSELYVKLAEGENNHMTLGQESLTLILEWIKDGAPDN